jgi:hypothetical protein
MKPDLARLTDARATGLPDAERDRLSVGSRPTRNMKIAVQAATRRSGREMHHEAIAKPRYEERSKALRLTSVDSVACFSDEGRFFGLEVAR